MLQKATTLMARVYGGTKTSTVFTPRDHVAVASTAVGAVMTGLNRGSASPAPLLGAKARRGSLFAIANDTSVNEKKLRQAMNDMLADERNSYRHFRDRRPQKAAYPERKLVDLPGVERRRDLPADPITRLFFQHKGDHALYYGTYDNPSEQDTDRLQIERREPKDWTFNVFTPVYDFCHRLREASEQRKRFVIVPSTLETRGCAKVLLDHGLVAGFRDFHNDRAFAVELKYFQNEPTINVIEPCSYDGKTEFEWSPKMMRRLMNTHGIHNRLVVYMCRTADNRIIDHVQAVKECIGGRGLMMAH